MADKYPLANGNWSNADNWNGGTLPGPDDDVYCDGKTITLDMDLTGDYAIKTLRTTQRSGGTAGGTVSVTTSRTIELTGTGTVTFPGSQHLITYNAAVGASLTITTGGEVRGGTTASIYIINNLGAGDVTITASTVSGGSNTYTFVVNNTGSGSITITASTVSGGSGSTSHCIVNNSAGNIYITSSTMIGGAGPNTYGVYNTSAGNIYITASTVTGGAGGSAYSIANTSAGNIYITSSTVTGGSGGSAYGVYNTSTGNIYITSSTTTGGTGANAYCVYNNSTGNIYITGDPVAGWAAAVYNASTGIIDINGYAWPSADSATVPTLINSHLTGGKIIFNGAKKDPTTGRVAGILGRCFVRDANAFFQFLDANEASRTFVDSGGVNNPPSPSDVRLGVKYGTGDAYTGTCAVPPSQSVGYGVPVDNTVGTAVLTADDARLALAGGGNWAGTITITDAVTQQPIAGASVSARQAGTLVATGVTGVSGQVTDWTLNSGNYEVSVRAAGYQPTTSSLLVSGDGWATTLALTVLPTVEITPPQTPDLCTVQFRIYHNGIPRAGIVCHARLLGSNQAVDGTVLSTVEQTAVTNEDGIAELQLVRRDAIAKGSGVYRLWVTDGRRDISRVETVIPSQATVLYEDLL